MMKLDRWLELAKEIAKDKVKTEKGLFALRCDLREINNHFIELGEEYIEYNLQKGNYDKDPYCENRLSINELEAIVKVANFREYIPSKLFGFKEKFNCFDDRELSKVVSKLFEMNIIK